MIEMIKLLGDKGIGASGRAYLELGMGREIRIRIRIIMADSLPVRHRTQTGMSALSFAPSDPFVAISPSCPFVVE